MKRVGIWVFFLASVAGCASTSWPTAVDPSAISATPDHFLVVDPVTGATEPSGPDCRNPMADPRDGTRLTLVRSSAGFGDYRPDAPRYGLAGNQLLRINCSDGRPIGAAMGAP